jgi:RNA polymerase sigma-70 factor (ECF subfamily)
VVTAHSHPARHRSMALDRPPAPADPPSEDTVLLVGALRVLPMVQRRALVLHYLLDRTIADIATETGASVGTVKSWLSRGRANMAVALGESTPAEPVVGGQDA